ncbi:MAG: NADPH-dependent assimilatory sulfite reductase hemoprotein subunit [Acidimicrobiia bacterium]|nr:NADPH-dependent assimilatory sulfite reductase hemoprotein subunit [Acidimicrobiia bacterium]
MNQRQREGRRPVDLETLKSESDHLRGTLAQELSESSDMFSEGAAQLLKFHGIYQQDDRDHRRGKERDYIFMVRTSLPGGELSAEQYLVCDDLADWVGDGSIRITTRQGFQWHHVRKGRLHPVVWTLNQALVTTIGACGDVVRNVVACPASPELGRLAIEIATHFRSRSSAYWDVWIDGKPLVSAISDESEPIYGESYLPRKFKIGIASPGDNCVDVYTHDLGVVTHEGDETITILAGGGQGRSHNRDDTYPRLASPLGDVPRDRLIEVIEAVVVVQRDHGNREDRKLARLKYLIDAWGLDRFREAVEDRLGWRMDPPSVLEWPSHRDHLGWWRGDDGWSVGVPIPSGRISNHGDSQIRTALRQIVDFYRPTITLTPQQNLIFSGISDADRPDIAVRLATISPGTNPLRIDALACVALPTCGLAVTDAERALPKVVDDLEQVLTELGLESEELGLRMTGCPNGCARPYNSEIGLVGRRKGAYDIHLGGAHDGTRLNRFVTGPVKTDDVAETLRPLLARYAASRNEGESFGNFFHRVEATVPV